MLPITLKEAWFRNPIPANLWADLTKVIPPGLPQAVSVLFQYLKHAQPIVPTPCPPIFLSHTICGPHLPGSIIHQAHQSPVLTTSILCVGVTELLVTQCRLLVTYSRNWDSSLSHRAPSPSLLGIIFLFTLLSTWSEPDTSEGLRKVGG